MTIPSTLLATSQLVPFARELDENKVTPGVLGFIVFALLGGAVWMLMKNMNKQFTKIDFDEGPGRDTPDTGSAATADAGATAERNTASAPKAGPAADPRQN
ncbi:hypothetical protein [Streptomyces meridianus]|uniref:Uncharacterized protein n=1 Tax=Streptomyces meridianus TaxID=2938945 RepID=A0ABT0X805_9ACTN|nr:hypothetical protein [Streptomyces meridianus]MCM2577847.1 hypothetical protein [Streptomyces meridianus]